MSAWCDTCRHSAFDLVQKTKPLPDCQLHRIKARQ